PVVLGTGIGMFLLLASLHLFYEVKGVLSKKKDLINEQYLVINKPVSLLNTISGNANTFSEQEIRDLSNIKAVEQVGKFTSNQFKVKAGFDFSGQSMYTDMFFESIPNDFLDIDASDWTWKPGEAIPIVLPSDYINLYNFGFAPVQGLPQISKATAMMAGLFVVIEGQDTSFRVQGRIAGFTDRINSVLVPEAFMNYANTNYGFINNTETSRLVLKCSDPSNKELNTLLESNGYESNAELMKSGRLNAMLRMVLSIVLGIGSIIVLLALLGFVQYAQLLINRSVYEIKTLLQLGYSYKTLLWRFVSFYAIIMLGISILSMIGLYILSYQASQIALEKGFEFSGSIHLEVVFTCIGLVLFFMVFNTINTRSILKKHAKPA
ncbi:MAG: hypothetical protein R2852_08115, partial [Bacteroidia bacterium]